MRNEATIDELTAISKAFRRLATPVPALLPSRHFIETQTRTKKGKMVKWEIGKSTRNKKRGEMQISQYPDGTVTPRMGPPKTHARSSLGGIITLFAHSGAGLRKGHTQAS